MDKILCNFFFFLRTKLEWCDGTILIFCVIGPRQPIDSDGHCQRFNIYWIVICSKILTKRANHNNVIVEKRIDLQLCMALEILLCRRAGVTVYLKYERQIITPNSSFFLQRGLIPFQYPKRDCHLMHTPPQYICQLVIFLYHWLVLLLLRRHAPNITDKNCTTHQQSAS